MKYLLKIDGIRSDARAVVEAESEEDAMKKMGETKFDFINVDMGDLKIEPFSADYLITEMCPHCGTEIEMYWNTALRGYKAFCPICGNRLMLCDECLHSDGNNYCDYNSETDTCKHNTRR